MKVGDRVRITGYAYLAEVVTGKRITQRLDWEGKQKDVVFVGWTTLFSGDVTGHDEDEDEYKLPELVARVGHRAAMVCDLARGERYRKPYPVWSDQIINDDVA